jgi:hypothetical protein
LFRHRVPETLRLIPERSKSGMIKPKLALSADELLRLFLLSEYPQSLTKGFFDVRSGEFRFNHRII